MSWQELAIEVGKQFDEQAQARGELIRHIDSTRFFTLALAGEAGELANLVKKGWRGDRLDLWAMVKEMADIRIYLFRLEQHLGINLDDVCEIKLREVQKRLADKAGGGA